nr:adenine deaminase [uncultured Peptostreptococcus sp.]
MDIRDYKKYVKYTLGKEKADLVLKDANIIMVQTGEVLTADIAIMDKYIVGIGDYEGVEELDCSNKYISPGFVDSHLHFESTLANPRELVHYASLSGTTTFIADPHEAANVAGIKGINYILDQTEDVSGDVYIMAPSCVPCKDGEDSGCIMGSQDLSQVLKESRILGLGEVMDEDAVIGLNENMMDKLELFGDRIIDGHLISIEGKKLSAYAMSGIKTDHESTEYKYAMMKVRNGMYVHIREGSAARNLEPIVKGIIENKTDISRFTFCTDDKHIEDIQREGHISHNVRKAISLGLDPIDAYKMATLNSAQCYGLRDIGMISVGKKANLIVIDDMEAVSIDKVMYEGKFISQDYVNSNKEVDTSLLNSINIDWFHKDMLAYKSHRHAIRMIEGEILTELIDLDIYNEKRDLAKGPILGKKYKDISKVAVIERHHNTGNYHVGKLLGYNIKNGAVASSVSHDSHNVIVVGDNDRDMMLAIEKLKELGGGYVLVEDGHVFDVLPLPVMGLISNLDSNIMNGILSRMIEKAHQMGVPIGIEPFIALSFIALPVIPEVRIRTRGLYDVLRDRYLD